ncbi:uncharacterized protein LOC124881954 isoform X1 [Girardinichthys multiradiatus]|uniref:uncharacterized protein LOC124881954 isoform X1 n=1 Tax=Girardinichthys multiradiatus TaxID=208333 RepID=UPI001FACCA65|nr:uncharacterized protein LOC124881954 isoform X1 [Girardinichthys multiradiatus]XP_047243916.1 uncharacterized protein LOC124881954 isoform X1 [Girardinichthys multiradiatus]XP_047243917.1 uncharacterized protein LOC124881954 isoform X1 [Girardinichthys multiradiatus]
MNILLKEIRNHSSSAAEKLEHADCRTDAELQSLTREDLHELFPGAEKLKLRKSIFEIINKQKPVKKLLEDLRGFIPDDFIRDALTSNGVLVDYLYLLKDMKTQLNNVQSFLEAHIGLLEDIKAQPQQKCDQSQAKVLVGATASTHDPREAISQNSQENQSSWIFGSPSFDLYGRSQIAKVTVKYKMVVSGKTFDAHLQILEQLKRSAQQLNLVESNDDCQIVFVFCPIVSRIGTDVEVAMKMVTGYEPVMLVLMHHAHEAKHVPTMATWYCSPNILQHFNVFYHEKMRGLITCKENDVAISAIQNELIKPKHPSVGSQSDNKVSSLFAGFFRRDNSS